MTIKLMKEMFEKMVVKKNASLISKYYHPDFLLTTNGEEMNYEKFLKDHEAYYQTPIEYRIEYEEETLLQSGNKVAGRIWITTKRPNEPANKLEVMLIAEYKEEKIYRLWELVYPDWKQLSAFKKVQQR